MLLRLAENRLHRALIAVSTLQATLPGAFNRTPGPEMRGASLVRVWCAGHEILSIAWPGAYQGSGQVLDGVL